MPFLGGEISEELETLIDEVVKRSEKSKSVNPEVRHAIEPMTALHLRPERADQGANCTRAG